MPTAPRANTHTTPTTACCRRPTSAVLQRCIPIGPAGRHVFTDLPDGGSVNLQIARTLGLVDLGVDLGAPTEQNYVAPEDRVSTITDALGHTISTQVNEWGAVISKTDALGRTTIFERDDNN